MTFTPFIARDITAARCVRRADASATKRTCGEMSSLFSIFETFASLAGFSPGESGKSIDRYAARASSRRLIAVIAPPRIRLASTESPGLWSAKYLVLNQYQPPACPANVISTSPRKMAALSAGLPGSTWTTSNPSLAVRFKRVRKDSGSGAACMARPR